MHDGCNARAWVHKSKGQRPIPGRAERRKSSLRGSTGQPASFCRDRAANRCARSHAGLRDDARRADAIRGAQRNAFYTWSDQRCCLPKGRDAARPGRHLPDLKAGDVLIFEEVLGPATGQAGDADPAHRHAVRLTRATGARRGSAERTTITEIEWGDEDALPFPLCISSAHRRRHGREISRQHVSVARGNIVLGDHGLTETNEAIPDTVPAPTIFRPREGDPCERREPISPAALSPRLKRPSR